MPASRNGQAGVLRPGGMPPHRCWTERCIIARDMITLTSLECGAAPHALRQALERAEAALAEVAAALARLTPPAPDLAEDDDEDEEEEEDNDL